MHRWICQIKCSETEFKNYRAGFVLRQKSGQMLFQVNCVLLILIQKGQFQQHTGTSLILGKGEHGNMLKHKLTITELDYKDSQAKKNNDKETVQ